MQVDIIPSAGTNADFEVRKREGAPVQYDDAYEGDPLFGPAPDGECMDWCEQHGHKFRHRKRVAIVPPHFFKDIEKKCDDAYRFMMEAADKCGWTFSSNATYRASAAWKEHPIHYCYSGDFGGGANFHGVTDESLYSDYGRNAMGDLTWLRGVAAGLWELGFTLTFDKDGKHTVFNSCPQWVTLDERDY